MKNKLILCMGSNAEPAERLFAAESELRAFFSEIRFSETCATEPIGEGYGPFFLNKVAVAYTYMAQDEVIRHLKMIERKLGRTPESKKEKRIPIDIDLLQWNACILKPEDLQRPYVVSLLRQVCPEGEEDKRTEGSSAFF